MTTRTSLRPLTVALLLGLFLCPQATAAKLPTALPVSNSITRILNKVLKQFPPLSFRNGEGLGDKVLNEILDVLDPSGESRCSNEFFEWDDHFPPIEIRMRNGVPTVTRVAPFSDAWRKDIIVGDTLLRIGDKDCAGATLPAIDRMLRGKPGTEVELLLLRQDCERTAKVSLRRETAPHQLFTATFDKKIFYIRPTCIDKNITDKLVGAQPEKGSKLVGIILDLRGAAGGGIEQARRICGRFLKAGPVARLFTPGKPARTVNLVPAASVLDARMIILTDAGTGPAGEIVAAALQENHRAVLLGGRTSGLSASYRMIKAGGSIVLRLPDTRAATPGGKEIFRNGVTPDIPAPQAKVPPRRWGIYRHQVLALLKKVKPADLPYPGREIKKKAKSVTISNVTENTDTVKVKTSDGKTKSVVLKSLEDIVLADYNLVRQYDRPFVRALNLLISMNIFYNQLKN